MPKILEVLTDDEFTELQDKNEIARDKYDADNAPASLHAEKVYLDTIEYLRLTGMLAQRTIPEVKAYFTGDK